MGSRLWIEQHRQNELLLLLPQDEPNQSLLRWGVNQFQWPNIQTKSPGYYAGDIEQIGNWLILSVCVALDCRQRFGAAVRSEQ